MGVGALMIRCKCVREPTSGSQHQAGTRTYQLRSRFNGPLHVRCRRKRFTFAISSADEFLFCFSFRYSTSTVADIVNLVRHTERSPYLQYLAMKVHMNTERCAVRLRRLRLSFGFPDELYRNDVFVIHDRRCKPCDRRSMLMTQHLS